MPRDALAARLLQTFLTELDDQVGVLESDLLAMERQGSAGDTERLSRVFRVAHTLKGAARVAHVPQVESVCHAMESRLADARASKRALSEQEIALLLATVDALAGAGTRLRAGEPVDQQTLGALERRLGGAVADGGDGAPRPSARGEGLGEGLGDGRGVPSGESHRATAGGDPESSASPSSSSSATPTGAARRNQAAEQAPTTGETPAAAAPAPHAPQTPQALRIDAARLDDLLHAAGQLAVTVARSDEQPETLEELASDAERWLARWRRGAPRLRQALVRAGATGERQLLDQFEAQLRQFTLLLGRVAVAVRGDSRALHRASAEMTDEVHRLRLRPFAEAVEALPRVVRDVAAAGSKRVRLELEGTDVEADRAVLDALREALLHLVRNAVDHGIEPPAERERLGKPAEGTVRVAAEVRGGAVRVTVADDGRGLDRDAVSEQLAARGLPVPESDDELVDILFQGGFTTRREATAISGRGVGLDVVKSALERARGVVRVRWTAGVGTSFMLETPLTLATQRAVIVAAGQQQLAIPSRTIERLLRVDPADVRESGGRRLLPTPDGPVPLVSLARLLGPPLVERPAAGRRPTVLLSVAERRLGITVDRFVDECELVVRPLERRGGGELAAVAGAAILADGRIALVLNSGALVAAGLGRQRAAAPDAAAEAPAAEPPAAPRLLVVDDSITTRTLEQSVLEAAGYEVVTAVDGADAWRLLQERGADLVLTDVEMPRMDGFTLCETIRASRRFAQLPVVLVTSLEAPEQRERGLEAGADAYVVKSGFDQEALLATVRDLLDRGGARE